MFELVPELISDPRGELVMYASRSATRCSSDGPACNAAFPASLRSSVAGAVTLRLGAADGDDVWPNSGETDAMIPVSNKTRSITRVRYKHATFQRQEKCDYNSYISRTAVRSLICKASVSDAAGSK